MELDVSGFAVVEGGSSADPEEFLTILNSDPTFVETNTLNTGKSQFDFNDASMFIWQSEVMENSHLFAIRDPDNRLVAALTVLVPHPKEQQPWIGALFVHHELGFREVAVPVLDALERTLAADGWQAVYVSPMESQTQAIEHWRANGYALVDSRRDNNEREVLVHRKLLTERGDSGKGSANRK